MICPKAFIGSRCEQAFICGHAIELEYTDRHGAPTSRVVEPHGLLASPPLWYLLAYDRLRGEPRMFRVDRIRAVSPRPTERFAPKDPRHMIAENEACGMEERE